MIRGTLGPEWVERAELVAEIRQKEGRGRQRVAGFRDSDGDRELMGAWSEAFVAQTYGLDWSHAMAQDQFRRRHAPDVGPVDVRSTFHARGGLLIRPGDPSDRIVVLVWCVIDPTPDTELTIAGWDYAGLCKVDSYLRHAGRKDQPQFYLLPWGACRLPSALFDVLEAMPA